MGHHFHNDAEGHLGTWLGSISGKAFEVASDVLQFLSDLSKETLRPTVNLEVQILISSALVRTGS